MTLSIVVSFVGLVLAALAIGLLLNLRQRFTQALGSSSGNLEDSLINYNNQVAQVDKRLGELTDIYNELKQKVGLASQKISIVRFNPFGDTGGDQSFALAVLDDHNSGYVLTSIHSRTGTRVYVKPIDFGESKYTLSKEEQQAIVQATKRTPNKETK